MKLTSFLKDNITEKDMLIKFLEYIPYASFIAIYKTDIQLFIQVLGSKEKGFDLTYIKTPNQLKVKKNNRPIIFLPQFRQELLRKYKFLSPNQLMSLIWKMVTVGKSDKLIRDEAYLQKWLNFPIDNAGLFNWNNFNKDKQLKVVSNLKINGLSEGYVSREQIRSVYIKSYMELWGFYFIKYLVKKYELKTKKKILSFLDDSIRNELNLKQKLSLEKDQQKLLDYKLEYSISDEEIINMFNNARKWERIPMKMTWYFKVKKQYEPDSTNMAQLYEDEYQVKMDWIKFEWNDRYLMEHEIKKYLMKDTEDKFEYLAIMENINEK